MPSNMPWIEKYRPNQFDDIVLDPYNRKFFQNIMEKRHFPNLLFYGPPGTGKTTTIINLINEYQDIYTRKNRESIIHLNASDERGIDIIRTQIYQFVKSKHIFETGLKFVILDEVDYMTKNAQQALKTLLQLCPQNVRFCLICNYISKIDESLQQEFICVRFNQLPKEEIHQFIRTITEKEGFQLNEDQIDTIRQIYQSDIRSMINFLQATLDRANKNVETRLCIITQTDWEQLFQICLTADSREIETNIIQLSLKYNIHKKHIMHNYLNYIIRTHTEIISREFFQIVENVVHASDDVPVRDLLYYFSSSLSQLFALHP